MPCELTSPNKSIILDKNHKWGITVVNKVKLLLSRIIPTPLRSTWKINDSLHSSIGKNYKLLQQIEKKLTQLDRDKPKYDQLEKTVNDVVKEIGNMQSKIAHLENLVIEEWQMVNRTSEVASQLSDEVNKIGDSATEQIGQVGENLTKDVQTITSSLVKEVRGQWENLRGSRKQIDELRVEFKEDRAHTDVLTKEIRGQWENVRGSRKQIDELRVEFKEDRAHTDVLTKEIRGQWENLTGSRKQIDELRNEFKENLIHTDSLAKEVRGQWENLTGSRKQIADQWDLLDSTKKQLNYHENILQELQWGQIFHDTITNISWMENKSFSLGRWAAGYQFMYVLARVLNDVRPTSILELGLGQTSKMTIQYAHHNECEHTIVEHDESWIEFMKREYTLSERTSIEKMDIIESTLEDGSKCLVYDHFADRLKDKQFDLILIDGPFGDTEEQSLSRIDVLGIMTGCLKKSFIIIMDDYNREGEKRTVRAMEEKLREKTVKFCSGIYKGYKHCYVITSIDNRFVCTL